MQSTSVPKSVIFIAVFFILISAFCFSQSAAPQPPPTDRDVDSYTLSPERSEKAADYARARYILYFLGAAYGIVLLIAFLSQKVAPRFRDWAEKMSTRGFLQVFIYSPVLVLALGLLTLPLDLYGHWIAVKYDQSIQSWGSWIWDWTKGQMIGIVIATILIWILYGVIRRSPKSWWFYFWLASLPLIIFLVFITPLVIEPLFFKFEPLEKSAPDLVTEIEKVTRKGGLSIPRERMFLMKASEKLKSVNAYVTGFGASRRVVVWDTTMQKMTQSQTLYVFGHEMGHYVLHHIVKTIAFIAVMLLVFLFIGFQFMHSLVAKHGLRWEIRSVQDLASLPVLLLLFSIFGFLASPLMNSYSRMNEHDADVYGLEVIHGIVEEPQKAAAVAFQVLGEINLSDPNPNPLIKIWLYTHPPLNERLVFVRNYDPWSSGNTPRYVK